MTFRSLSLRGPVNWVTDDEPKTSLEKPGTAQTSSDPQWAQMQLLGAVCETFHHPVDQMFHQENSNKGILCVPRRQPEEQQLCLSFCAFHHLLESKGRCWQTAGQGKANRNTDIIQQTPSTGHAKLLVPVNAEWIMGREGENLLRKCWKMWHFHFQDVADMLKTPLSAHLAQLEHCKNQTLPVIFFPFANQHILQHSFLPLAGREVSGVTIQLWWHLVGTVRRNSWNLLIAEVQALASVSEGLCSPSNSCRQLSAGWGGKPCTRFDADVRQREQVVENGETEAVLLGSIHRTV